MKEEQLFLYEYLASIFMCSKATVHDAIEEKGIEAKRLIERANLRTEARDIALQHLIQEEKQKLRQERRISKETDQMNERYNVAGEGM